MKRATIGLVAAALAAGSVFVAAPAHAAPPDQCLEENPQSALAFVTIDGFDVIIDINQLPEITDWEDVAEDLVDLARCLDDGVVTNRVGCAVLLISNRLLTIDFGTGEFGYVSREFGTGVITIHGNDLVADATATSC